MPTLTIELTEGEHARLAELARARGVDAPECARALLKEFLYDTLAELTDGVAEALSNGPTGASSRKPIWMRAVEAGAALPVEERARIPRDGSVNVDHYVYGLPKRA